MKKIFALLIAVVMCLSLFTACKDEKQVETNVISANEDFNNVVVLEAEGIQVSKAFYNFIYSMTYDNMAQQAQFYGDDWENMEIEEGKTIGDYIKETTSVQIEQFVTARVLAQKYGITEKDVADAVKEQKKQVLESYGGEEAYVEFLNMACTTDGAISSYLETYEILNLLFEKLAEKGEAGYVAAEDLEKSFLEACKDKLRVQHILISTQADESTGAPAKSDEEAKKIAEEVIEKLDKGEDFDKLIPDYNEDPGMSSGQFYLFGPGEMVEEFETASKELKVGEYTKTPVKSDFGYHVIKKYEINAKIPEFEDYKVSKQQEKAIQVIEEEAKNITFKWDDKAVEDAVKFVKDEVKKSMEAAKQEAEKQAATEEAPVEEAEETPAEETTEE